MAQHIQASVLIDGEIIHPFPQITIHQHLHQHHTFEVVISTDAFDKGHFDVLQRSKKFMGKKIVIKWGMLIFDNKLPDNEFLGLITNVGVKRSAAGEHDLVVRGHSPTILMDGINQCKSYTKKSIAAIVEELLHNVPRSLNTSIDPMYKGIIPYIVQYQESNFLFLQRLAARFGEWCFFDGQKLVFGALPSGAAIELPLAVHLSDLEFNLRIAPLNANAISYNYLESETYQKKSADIKLQGLTSFSESVLEQSSKTFVQTPLHYPGELVEKPSDLDDVLMQQKAVVVNDLIIASGKSDNPYLNTGTFINITGDQVSEIDIGKMLVSSVVHSISGNLSYENHFEAIPSIHQFPPINALPRPEGNNQPARVMDNADPESLGRIKVKFNWQEEGDTTPWIRVSTPMAGKGKEGRQGFYFTPEIGDEVMVGFEDNNNDKPFVIGSLYHKKVAPTEWKDKDNNIKVISTRNGNHIFFIDKDGKEEIRIMNKSSDDPTNSICLSMEEGGKIKIETKGDLELKGKNIKITASDQIKMKSGKTTMMEAKNIALEAENDFTIKASSLSAEANDSVKIKSQKTNLEATTVSIKGTSKLAMEGAVSEIKSQKLSIDGGAMATVKAGIIQLN